MDKEGNFLPQFQLPTAPLMLRACVRARGKRRKQAILQEGWRRHSILVLVLANPHASVPRGSCLHVHEEGGESHPAPRGAGGGVSGMEGALWLEQGAGEPRELHLLWSLVLHKVMSRQGTACFGDEQEVPGRQA